MPVLPSKRTVRSIVPACALLIVAAVTGAANAAVADGRSAAALSLLETAKQDLSTGQAEAAAALIERALRIDPSNPALWHYLGLARRDLGDTLQADAMAAKSRSLTGADRALRARNAPPTNEITPALGSTAGPRTTDGARAWSSVRSWFGSRREASASPRNAARPGIAARDSTRSERLPSSEECQLWFFDERGRRQSWIMKCDDARRYAARGGSAVMIKTGAAAAQGSRSSNEAQQ
jgi:tetratricopeptide (TPR) repeat protein